MSNTQDFWDIRVPYGKIHCAITGKKLDNDTRFKLIMCCDRAFCGHRLRGANRHYDLAIWSLAGVPSSHELKPVITEWQNKWGCYPSYGTSLFDTDLFLGNSFEWSFFHPRTGKVGAIRTVSSEGSTIRRLWKSELEWFAKSFPKASINVTFNLVNEIVTLHIENGKIEKVKPLNWLKLNKKHTKRYTDLYSGSLVRKQFTMFKLTLYHLRAKFLDFFDKGTRDEEVHNFHIVSLLDSFYRYFSFDEAVYMIDKWKTLKREEGICL